MVNYDELRRKYIENLKGAKNSFGKKQLLKHLKGKKLSRTQAIAAFCCWCMCYYEDGLEDCCDEICPLHPYMQYNKDKEKSTRGKKKDDTDKNNK